MGTGEKATPRAWAHRDCRPRSADVVVFITGEGIAMWRMKETNKGREREKQFPLNLSLQNYRVLLTG